MKKAKIEKCDWSQLNHVSKLTAIQFPSPSAKKYPIQIGKISSCVVSPSKRFILCTWSGLTLVDCQEKLKVWLDVDDHDTNDNYYAAVFSSDEHLIAATDWNSVVVFDVWTCTRQFYLNIDSPNTLRFWPHSHDLLVISADFVSDRINISNSDQTLPKIFESSEGIEGADLSSDGTRIALCAYHFATLVILDSKGNQIHSKTAPPQEVFRTAHFIPNSHRLIAATDYQIFLLSEELETQTLMQSHQIRNLALSRTGVWLLLASEAGAQLMDTETLSQIHQFSVYNITATAFFGDKVILADKYGSLHFEWCFSENRRGVLAQLLLARKSGHPLFTSDTLPLDIFRDIVWRAFLLE